MRVGEEYQAVIPDLVSESKLQIKPTGSVMINYLSPFLKIGMGNYFTLQFVANFLLRVE